MFVAKPRHSTIKGMFMFNSEDLHIIIKWICSKLLDKKTKEIQIIVIVLWQSKPLNPSQFKKLYIQRLEPRKKKSNSLFIYSVESVKSVSQDVGPHSFDKLLMLYLSHPTKLLTHIIVA